MRGAVVLMIGFVALAQVLGLEVILGAFMAGALLKVIDKDVMMTHPHFSLKLEAIGFGFLIPVFFVTSGVTFDLASLFESVAAAVRIPVFLVGLLMVRGLPALFYKSDIGARRSVAAALLQATSLPFIVAAAQIGIELGAVSEATAARARRRGATVGADLSSCRIDGPSRRRSYPGTDRKAAGNGGADEERNVSSA